MIQTRSDPARARTIAIVPPKPAIAPEFVIEIGEMEIPVYGDASQGWSIEERDIVDRTPYRYRNLDELVFAVLNFCVHMRGSA